MTGTNYPISETHPKKGVRRVAGDCRCCAHGAVSFLPPGKMRRPEVPPRTSRPSTRSRPRPASSRRTARRRRPDGRLRDGGTCTEMLPSGGHGSEPAEADAITVRSGGEAGRAERSTNAGGCRRQADRGTSMLRNRQEDRAAVQSTSLIRRWVHKASHPHYDGVGTEGAIVLEHD